jgi:hypothetical protein
MTNGFETAREQVRNSVSSIFSKTDVLQLLHAAEEMHTVTKPEIDVDQIIDMVSDEVECVLGNFQLEDLASVGIYGREITLDFDVMPLMEDVETAIEGVRGQLKKS